jgi:hypothetical protein
LHGGGEVCVEDIGLCHLSVQVGEADIIPSKADGGLAVVVAFDTDLISEIMLQE